MYELIQLSEHDYYIECPSRMGIVRVGEQEVVMIDSGNDKDAAKKALRHIEASGWALKAIYNTHAHSDHIGGNRLLQSRTGCRIYTPGVESAFTNFPILEPTTLFGGFPPRELLSKSSMAQPSTADILHESDLPDGFRLLLLPGHSAEMIGILTPDGTAFIGDCLLSQETLEKYALSYVYDIETYVQTLVRIKELQANVFVASHAVPQKDIRALADFNLKNVDTVSRKILGFCKEPCTLEELLKKVFDSYHIEMSVLQYCLIGTTIKSYLGWMRKQGRMELRIEDNRLLWYTL